MCYDGGDEEEEHNSTGSGGEDLLSDGQQPLKSHRAVTRPPEPGQIRWGELGNDARKRTRHQTLLPLGFTHHGVLSHRRLTAKASLHKDFYRFSVNYNLVF
uniref:Uncharacterized protein n=1 Tax=Nothobranchius kuhntae TaxID=321403 RepID=A0A1A8JMQ6_NOTKU